MFCIGSLDIQYIMGMSQVTPSTFYYYSGDSVSTFVTYVQDLADMQNPPLVNSMSYGSDEYVCSVILYFCFDDFY